MFFLFVSSICCSYRSCVRILIIIPGFEIIILLILIRLQSHFRVEFVYSFHRSEGVFATIISRGFLSLFFELWCNRLIAMILPLELPLFFAGRISPLSLFAGLGSEHLVLSFGEAIPHRAYTPTVLRIVLSRLHL